MANQPLSLGTFGKRLKVARADRGMSQIELRTEMEQRFGISIGQTYISELERTGKAPTLPVAAAMAKVLGVSLDYLGLITDEPGSHDESPAKESASPAPVAA